MSSFIILLEPPGVTLSNAKDSAINIINKTALYSLIWISLINLAFYFNVLLQII